MTTGIIGKKLGMTQVFVEDGSLVPVTAIEAGPCTVVQLKTPDSDGYKAIQLGFGRKKRANKPESGHAKGKGPFAALREFRVDDLAGLEVGKTVDAGVFAAGDLVDVTGRSRGMGFAGGVRRYHFGGGPKTHGQSDRHRAPGSIGAGTSQGHVLKGLRMAGHMGDVRVTTRNLTVVRVDPQKNLLLIQGAVPGPKNALVIIRRSRVVRKAKQAPAPAKKQPEKRAEKAEKQPEKQADKQAQKQPEKKA